MFLVPLLIAALLLILGVGIALFSLETKYLPRLGLTLWKMHATLEQYETTFSSLEVFIWTYLGAVGMALLLTICFTNFFLTRSLSRHISAPLDELVAGVERIQGGNLDGTTHCDPVRHSRRRHCGRNTAEPFPADKRCGDAEAAVRGDGEHSRQSRRRTSPRG